MAVADAACGTIAVGTKRVRQAAYERAGASTPRAVKQPDFRRERGRASREWTRVPYMSFPRNEGVPGFESGRRLSGDLQGKPPSTPLAVGLFVGTHPCKCVFRCPRRMSFSCRHFHGLVPRRALIGRTEVLFAGKDRHPFTRVVTGLCPVIALRRHSSRGVWFVL